MGCTNHRVKGYSNHELFIISTEEKMGFYKIRSDKIDTIFRRFSVALRMNITQFSMACRELRLNLPGLGNPDAAVTRFFNLFKENTNFNQRQLSALGVVLGNGNAKDKARVLFKIYDCVKDNTLDQDEIRTIIEDVVYVSLIALPKLAVFELRDKDKIDDLEKFNRKLRGALETIINYYEIIILSSKKEENPEETDGKKRRKSKLVNITIDEFIEKFDNEPMKVFCEAAMLRHFAVEKYSQVIAPRDLVKDYLMDSLYGK